jgi:HSP20 family molecular chaperone IbpA
MAEKREKSLAKTESGQVAKERVRETLVPPVDVFEEKDNVTLIADLPGVGKDALDLQIDKDIMKIHGKIQKTMDKDTGGYYTEFPEKDYYRAFTVGEEIDRDKINASINNGVLKVVLPKRERAKPKKIEIKVS